MKYEPWWTTAVPKPSPVFDPTVNYADAVVQIYCVRCGDRPCDHGYFCSRADFGLGVTRLDLAGGI